MTQPKPEELTDAELLAAHGHAENYYYAKGQEAHGALLALAELEAEIMRRGGGKWWRRMKATPKEVGMREAKA